ncbi:MAG: ribonuclease P protein component, partial [Gammaproteobacteria bacterium]|nr:ribonuclease P protein component [Gammaproteobacteria bacterium]
ESPTFPFTRQHRLLDRIDFHNVMSAPQHRLGADVFLLLARKNTVGQGRLGLIIAKKNVKRATRRNWVKRQCREYFRHHQHDVASFDIVILAKKGIADLNHDELTQRLDRVWNKLAGYGPLS